jgi:hypothetical protein
MLASFLSRVACKTSQAVTYPIVGAAARCCYVYATFDELCCLQGVSTSKALTGQCGLDPLAALEERLKQQAQDS